MGKKATKAADNMYYLARCEAADSNDDFSSREKAAEIIGIDRTRLARIELDTITPYPEEVEAMAEAYNMPELCNSFCARECPIGRHSVHEVTIDDFDRLALKVLGSLKDIDSLRASLCVAVPTFRHPLLALYHQYVIGERITVKILSPLIRQNRCNRVLRRLDQSHSLILRFYLIIRL